MGLFDFFRKKLVNQVEKVEFNNLNLWINERKLTYSYQRDLLKEQINQRIIEFHEVIDREIGVLEKFDIGERNLDDRVKAIIRGNLGMYIFHLRILISALNKLDREDEEIIDKINSIFSNFDKNSKINSQKLSHLLQEELKSVKIGIGSFLKGLQKNLDENRDYIKILKLSSKISSNLAKIEELNENNIKLKKEFEEFNEDIKYKEKEISDLESKINIIKKSKEYKDNINKKEKVKKEKDKIEISILELKSLIDFKALQSFFHINQEDMILVKEYKDNFKIKYEGDKGKRIIELLDEAKIESIKVKTKIDELNLLEKEVGIIVVDKDKTFEIGKLIELIKNQISELEISKNKDMKKEQESQNNLNELKKSIKEELISFDVELV